ncbi:MAG: hypothetical protein HY939_01360 [Gammaproteobacteria bacterium]|nr:hypothetical protein [Gammaproteobacteria bacterium]
MHYLSGLLLFIVFYFIPVIAFGMNKIVYFEPEIVELDGVIKTLKFPGPPNYENIKTGDADETGLYIILHNSIDVNLATNSQIENNEPEKNVKLIQILIQNNNDFKKIKDGNIVHVVGVLSSALTGHHHARILLKVNKIKILSMKKTISKMIYVTDEDKKFLKYQYLQQTGTKSDFMTE